MFRWYSKSLRARLILIVVSLTSLPIAGAILFQGHLSAEDSRADAAHDLGMTANNLALSVEKWDQSMVFALENLRRQPDIISMDPQRQKPVLQQMARVYSRFAYIHISDTHGINVSRADDKEAIDYHDRHWFLGAIAGHPVTRETLISRSTGNPAVTLAAPVLDGNKIVGVAAVGVELTSILEDARLAKTGATGYAIVVDENGKTLAHPDPAFSSTLKDISSFPPVSFALTQHRGMTSFTDDQGNEWFAYSIPISNGWSAITLERASEIFATDALVQRTASAVALCAMLLVAVLISVGTGRIFRPIQKLTQAAHSLASGHWSTRVPEDREDELGVLARSFNAMASQLEKGYRLIEEEVARRTAELTRNNEELRHARLVAESANRAKDQFLANMSHEIRTPMMAIMGYSDVLCQPSENQNPEDRREAMDSIRRNGQHLLSLINDILDISQINAGAISVTRTQTDPRTIMRELEESLSSRAQIKQLDLRFETIEPIPAAVQTDHTRLRQIVANLINNAIKFSTHGLVRVRMSCSNVDQKYRLRFEVTDGGIGMSDEQIAKIFKPFSQADTSMTRRFGGMGIGLPISKSLAEILGGELTVQSQLGTGSTFAVTIDGGAVQAATTPAVAPSAPPAAKPAGGALNARILLAEDGPDNQRLVSMFLRKAGAQVQIAENGRIAVDLVQSQPFDLILMDMQMPEMDGYAATRELRSRGCKLPIVALTAHAMPEDRGKCIDAGCTDYLTKPIERNSFLKNVADHLASASKAA